MSVRVAELLMGLVTLAVSVGLMVDVWTDDLNIGWVPGRGPGAGMWPFWLAAGMALASLATLVRWFQGATPESRNTDAYIERDTVFLVVVTALALLALLTLIELIGMYFAFMLFLAFYLKVIGRHTWKVTGVFVLAAPVFIYLLFEVALTKYLPKGLPFFEELFLAVDDVRYQIQYGEYPLLISGGIALWVAASVAVALHAERRGLNGYPAFFLSLVASPVVGGLVYARLGRGRGTAGGEA